MAGQFRENWKRLANKLPATNTSQDNADIVRYKDQENLTARATGLQGYSVATTAPTDGQVLVWDNAASTWKPGTNYSTDATSIQSIAVSTGTPSSTQVLAYDAGAAQYVPSGITSGDSSTSKIITVGSGVDADYSSISAAVAAGYNNIEVIGPTEEPAGDINIPNHSGLYVNWRGGHTSDFEAFAPSFVFSAEPHNTLMFTGNGKIKCGTPGEEESFIVAGHNSHRVIFDGLDVRCKPIGEDSFIFSEGTLYLSNCNILAAGGGGALISCQDNSSGVFVSNSILYCNSEGSNAIQTDYLKVTNSIYKSDQAENNTIISQDVDINGLEIHTGGICNTQFKSGQINSIRTISDTQLPGITTNAGVKIRIRAAPGEHIEKCMCISNCFLGRTGHVRLDGNVPTVVSNTIASGGLIIEGSSTLPLFDVANLSISNCVFGESGEFVRVSGLNHNYSNTRFNGHLNVAGTGQTFVGCRVLGDMTVDANASGTIIGFCRYDSLTDNGASTNTSTNVEF